MSHSEHESPFPQASCSVDFEEKLIEMVQKHENLWMLGATKSKDVELLTQTWDTIATALRSDRQTCKEKWRYLRDTYVKKKKFIRNSGGVLPGKRIKWRYYDNLEFLADCVTHRDDYSLTMVPREDDCVAADQYQTYIHNDSSDDNFTPMQPAATIDSECVSVDNGIILTVASNGHPMETAVHTANPFTSDTARCGINHAQGASEHEYLINGTKFSPPSQPSQPMMSKFESCHLPRSMAPVGNLRPTVTARNEPKPATCDVKPTFTSLEGCSGISMLNGVSTSDSDSRYSNLIKLLAVRVK